MPLYLRRSDRERDRTRAKHVDHPDGAAPNPVAVDPTPVVQAVGIQRDYPRGPGHYVVRGPSEAFIYKQAVSEILREYLHDELAIAKLSNRLYDLRPK